MTARIGGEKGSFTCGEKGQGVPKGRGKSFCLRGGRRESNTSHRKRRESLSYPPSQSAKGMDEIK